MLLPSDHALTRMIVMHEHERQMYVGLTGTLAAVRSRFWILNSCSTLRKIIFQCMIPFRADPRNVEYQMENLPDSRLNNNRSFTVVGISLVFIN